MCSVTTFISDNEYYSPFLFSSLQIDARDKQLAELRLALSRLQSSSSGGNSKANRVLANANVDTADLNGSGGNSYDNNDGSSVDEEFARTPQSAAGPVRRRPAHYSHNYNSSQQQQQQNLAVMQRE